MQILAYCVIVLAFMLVAGRLLWDRYRRTDHMERYFLIDGLTTLCQEYLGYVTGMSSGQHDIETIRYLDSQRQVTHDQLLLQLGLTRDHVFDMTRFARFYLERNAPPEVWEGDIDE
jgi:hypothetical protein